jgi:anti-anti-sigma factor
MPMLESKEMLELLEPGAMAEKFITLSQVDSVQVMDLRLPEQLDSDEFDQLNESFMRVLDGRIDGKWVLDLSAVNYMGSSVLGLMINIRQHIKSGGGKLALAGLTPRMAAIFHTCCLEKLFTIAKTREDAVRAVAK